MSEVQPLPTPVFKLKAGSELEKLHQEKIKALEAQNKFFDEAWEWLGTHGCTQEEAQHFAFYSPQNFGWFGHQAPMQLLDELKVNNNKGFRAVKKRSQLYKDLREIFKKYEKQIEDVDHLKMSIVITYQDFYTESAGISGFYVKNPQKILGQYFIGGENVKTDNQTFKENYEPFDYEEYLKLFSQAIKEK